VVEADYLRAYRSKGVSLQRLRPFVADCRERFGLHPRAVTFLERVDRGGDASADVALALMPDGRESPVRQEPGVSSGASAVGDISAAPRGQAASAEDRVTEFGVAGRYIDAASPPGWTLMSTRRSGPGSRLRYPLV